MIEHTGFLQVFEDAKLIGYTTNSYDYARLCVWYGGYSFNVYSANNYNEVSHFTNGEMAGMTDMDEKKTKAKEVMEERNFTVIE